MLPNGCPKVRVLTWRNTGHHAHIFSRLFLQDCHGIVYRYNTDHTHLIIHNRNCDQTVFIDQTCHLFLIIMCIDIEHVRLHNLFNQTILTGCQQIFHIDNTNQFSLFRHIACVDCLTVDSNLTNL